MKLFRTIFWGVCCSLHFLPGMGQENGFLSQMRPPLRIPLEYSGSFMELRSDHFHQGVDIRTRQREGIPVYAAADGVINRVCVLEKGYGKVIYLEYADRYVGVYAHLSKFSPAIERKIRKRQRMEGTEYVSLENVGWRVKKGKRIARSGNTGSSGGPHLHYELRKYNADTGDFVWINPFKIPCMRRWDGLSPRLYEISFYPMDTLSELECRRLELSVDSLQREPKVYALGKIGLGVSALDYMEDMPFKYGLYSLKLKVNGELWAVYRLDSLHMEASLQYYSHIDTLAVGRRKVEKLFRYPEESCYPFVYLRDGGILEIERDRTYRIQIDAEDWEGNVSFFDFYIVGKEV